MQTIIDALPKLLQATGETLTFLVIAMVVGGIIGLFIGTTLVVTRKGGLVENRWVYFVCNLLVNFVRPIPFVILLFALMPLSRLVVGTGIENKGFTFVLCFAASFGIARLVEQNLLTVDPGVIEAARSMGASPLRIIFTVLYAEGLAPLILGYTFAFIAVVDMSAIATLVGGGGLGTLAIVDGFRQYKFELMWVAVVLMILIVHLAQMLGTTLARKVRRR